MRSNRSCARPIQPGNRLTEDIAQVPSSTVESGFAHVIVSETAGVGWVRLNRPRVRNALNRQLINELMLAVETFDASANIRVIVLEGDEHAFSAGADKTELSADTAQLTRPRILDLEDISKPIIAAVSGYALGGGCEIALMADIVVAAESAQFGLPEIGLGIIPGAGGTQRMPRAVGRAKAADLILTGRRMNAQEAESAGLVSRVVADAELKETVEAVARAVSSHSSAALRAAKQAMRVTETEGLQRGLKIEQDIWWALRAETGHSEVQ